MADLKIDSQTGDLDVSDNSLYVTNEGLESIAQRLRIRLRFFFREWVLDRSVGTKWFELVLRKDVDKFLADQEVRRVVLETPQIKIIDQWDSSVNASTREYDVTATVRTTLGQTFTFGFADVLSTSDS
jgi:hypothetical protein